MSEQPKHGPSTESRAVHLDHYVRLTNLENEQKHNATKTDLKALEKELVLIETELKHSASREDLKNLEQEMEEKHEQLVRGQNELRSRLEQMQGGIDTMKWLIAAGLTAATVISTLAGIVINNGGG